MVKRRKVSNPLALAVLVYLMAEPMHTYELGRRLQEHGKDRNIKYNRGSLYMVVEQLGRAGFVAERETVRDTQRPERTIYGITEAGRAELYDWMHELVAVPQEEYPHFGVALSLLAVLAPAQAAELLGRRLAALREQAEEARGVLRQAVEDDVPWVFLVEERYRLTLVDAEIRFVTDLVESLRDPAYERTWQRMKENMT
ncbi:PadR family transcriptional regulator [Planotetraspora kaengkrachanensis]|uniref:PadR family transcriptional regulator n=1 Tax=Planotetraspora kaengkrachanensis TaxID=575193 RepID=A0A8J3LUM4_9ACTN|nr:PadR family transcriptional regulator [Planotetraspora kaengkrachanensis]GIG78119.1 PadR family transcriptional regulator [Planotetraspora kaengkrachanensis]